MTYKCPRAGQDKDRKKKKRKPGQAGQTGGGDSEPEEPLDPKPALKIMKKRSPEEQAKVEARKMVKLKKERDAEIRRALAEAAEDICRCAYMDVYCNDLTAIDNVIDKCPAFKEPECLCQEESLSSLSSNATWDIEYTPPFGCFDLSPRKKQVYVHVETQYSPADAGIVQPSKPKKGKEEPASKEKAKEKEEKVKQKSCKRKCCSRCR
ncbi:hypothetical protein MSG28_006764 [Choristoneura fumiferana]|uniref:Uncharacterized protein n=1 Tax=Choristoneura fumiferana TaxID=7141 RepID=A0ACC0JL05_CHOFU|nr:hypothetical protein MSG28_006764 [Choristoneura fumiferana]